MFLRVNFNWKFVFNVLLGVFRFCGLCPIKIDLKEKSTKFFSPVNIILLIWSLIHIAVVVILMVFGFKAFIADDYGISDFNNILKFSIMILTHFLAIVESIFVRENFVKIRGQMNYIDELLHTMLPDYEEKLKNSYRKTSRKIIIWLTIAITLELIIIANIRGSPSWTFMWGISIIPLMMSRMRHLQHTLYIDMLSCRFCVIKNELKSIVKFTKMESNKLVTKNFHFYEGLFRKISTIKNVYNKLWETSLFINRSFGVSQLANLLQNFIQLTCDLYLLYSFLFNNNFTYILGNFSSIF
jgi:hypothetical protein